MLNLRIVQSLVFAVALLLGQQGGALHALRHALTDNVQKQGKQGQTSHDCEQCLSFAQLGSALNVGFLSFDLSSDLIQATTQHYLYFLIRHTLPALARGPPSLQSPV
jgi:hypothetical protein